MIIYRNKRKRIDELSVRIELTEGLFVKYANAVEPKCRVKTVPCLREINFISKILPTAKKSRPQKWCVVC
jgi:hypothetical protein